MGELLFHLHETTAANDSFADLPRPVKASTRIEGRQKVPSRLDFSFFISDPLIELWDGFNPVAWKEIGYRRTARDAGVKTPALNNTIAIARYRPRHIWVAVNEDSRAIPNRFTHVTLPS